MCNCKTTSRPIAADDITLPSLGAERRAAKADSAPPFWYRDSAMLADLMKGAWGDVSSDVVDAILKAFKENSPRAIEAALAGLKDLGADFAEALGDSPQAIFSNMFVKAEAYWKLHAAEAGVEGFKSLSEAYRDRVSELWGNQVKQFAEKYPERILEPEITRQLEYMVQTEKPSIVDVSNIVERLERVTGGEDYFNGLSDVQISRAFHADGVRHADENGIGTVQAIGPLDDKTCDVCWNLVGVDIDVGAMLEKIDADLGIEDPEEYVQAWSFPRMRDIGVVDRAELPQMMIDNGFLPPFHNFCRHYLSWKYLKEEGNKEGKTSDNTDSEPEAEAPND
jgi:hypothetical protein